MIQKSRGIFLKKDEWLCLASPLLLVPFIIWELGLHFKVSGISLYVTGMVAEMVLGGTAHTGLTWGLVALSPETRFLLRDINYPWQKLVGLGFLFFGLSAALFCLPSKENSFFWLRIFFTVDWFMVYYHSITQTQGLSFTYSYKLNPDPQLRPLIHRVHKQQKILIGLLYIISTLPGLNFILGLPIMNTLWEKSIGATVALALVFAILRSNRRLPFDQGNKIIFMSRLFLFPLSFFSIIAAVGYRAMHGIEYIFIYRKILGSSRKNLLRTSRWTTVISIGVFVVAGAFGLFSINQQDGITRWFMPDGELPIWFRLLCAMAVSRSYMHYFTDRLLFRMRDPAVSRWMGPLLNS